MPGNRVALRTFPSRWPLDDVLQGAIVLNEIEIRGGDGLQRRAQIAHRGNGLQENFREHNGGTPVEIDTAGMHLAHQRAEEAEIEMR